MATTSNFQLTLLEVGQKDKEVTINTALQSLDNKINRYLGEFATDPNSSGVAPGCTYFNTGSSNLRCLRQMVPGQMLPKGK